MTSVLHFSYFNKVYNHFYTCNYNDQVFHNFYNLKRYNFYAHIRLHKSHVNELSTVPHIGDDNKV